MPRRKEPAATVTDAVSNLLGAVTQLVTGLQGVLAATPPVRAAAGDVGRAGKAVGVAARAKSAKLRRALKRYWANLKGRERAARVAKILKGKGPKPKVATTRRAPKRTGTAKPAARKPAPRRKGRANPWAKLSPEQRAERIAKMRAGRKAKAAPASSALEVAAG